MGYGVYSETCWTGKPARSPRLGGYDLGGYDLGGYDACPGAWGWYKTPSHNPLRALLVARYA
ncbi:MAG: hypothetical protein Kow00122_07990 [Thermoleophilia bacterium]